MIPGRVQIAVVAATLLAALTAASLLAPTPAAHAQAQPASQLCRVLLDSKETGVDRLEQHAKMQITSINREPDGSVVMLGSGESVVDYFQSSGCPILGLAHFTTRIDVIVSSDDGRTADFDFSPQVGSHEVQLGGTCKDGTSLVSLDPPPTVTMPLKDGAVMDFDDSAGTGKHAINVTGQVTLAFCKSPGQ